MHDRQGEFHTLLEQLAQAPRPKLDYSQMPTSALLSVEFYCRLLTYQACYMVLLRSFAAMLPHRVIPERIASPGGLSWGDIVAWSNSLTVKTLKEAYATYPHPPLFGLLADLQMEAPFIEAEMAARLAKAPLACELIRLDWLGEDRTAEVYRLLKVDKVKSFQPWREGSDNLRQAAVVKALEVFREPSPVEAFPLPPFPVPLDEMLPDERAAWQGPMAAAWANGRRASLSETIPILAGEKESIPEKARAGRRAEWSTRDSRAKLLKDNQEDIAREIHPGPHAVNIPLKVDAQLARYRAQKRWGKRGRKFVDALRGGASVTAAATHAGISRTTAHKYMKELHTFFSPE